MANVIGSLIHKIDTPGAGLIFPDSIRFKSVRWVGGTVAGHIAEIQDSNSITIWRSVASGPNHIDSDLIENIFWDGYKVITLQSGILYIELS